ncbi:hypothetical protein LAP8962_03229 [Lactiplantibacillus plantarum]|nr:hypothetical protein LAP8962_03229 [Lactiplantibacillus plantarum]
MVAALELDALAPLVAVVVAAGVVVVAALELDALAPLVAVVVAAGVVVVAVVAVAPLVAALEPACD